MSQSPDPEGSRRTPSAAQSEPTSPASPSEGQKFSGLRWLRRRSRSAPTAARHADPRSLDLAILLRGATILAAVGFAVVAFVIQMTGTFRVRDFANLRAFVNGNELAAKPRTQMLLWLGAGAAAGLLASLVLYLWRGRRVVSPLDAHTRRPDGSADTWQPSSPRRRARAALVLRTGRLFAPLLLPGLAWPLLLANEWDALSRASGITFLALIAELCVRGAAGELSSGRLALARFLARGGRAVSRPLARMARVVSIETVVVALAVAFYAVSMSYGTILQHHQFGTFGYDLGNYDNMFFNMLHGRPFRTMSVFPTGGTWSMLSTHAELTMFVLLPFYAIHPGSETLLVMQSAALAMGAIPLYRFAARRLPRLGAMVIAVSYLLYAPMHQANFYDIHFQPFAVAFVLWAVDMLDTRRPVLCAIFTALALGCREDVPIGFAVLGVFLLLTGKHTRAAIVMIVAAIAYFVIIKFVVMPRFGSWWFSDLYKDLYPPGENTYGGVVKTLLTNPAFVWKTLITTDKIVLLFLVLGPLAFLPLRRGLLWMSLLPGVPFTLLTTGYGPTVQISFQYVLLFVPFIFLAAVVALASYERASLGRIKLAGALGGVVLATMLTGAVWGAMPPGDKFRGGFRDIPQLRRTTALERQKRRDLIELAAKIPRDAPVAVSETEHPHLSNRLNILALRSGYQGADYIIYAEDSGGGGANHAVQALGSGGYELVERRAATQVALLRKKAP